MAKHSSAASPDRPSTAVQASPADDQSAGLAARGTGGQSRGNRSQVRRGPPIAFLLPAVVAVVGVVVLPAVVSLVYSFTNYDGFNPTHWVGLDNFRTALTDPQTRSSIVNTLKLAVFVLILQNVFGLALALALEKKFFGRSVLKVCFFLPVIISSVVVGYLWQYIYTPDGVLNRFLRLVHLGSLARPWLGDPHAALWAIGVVIVWQLSGYAMVIYAAGLQNVQSELIEAAALDGANRWQRLRYVKLPALAPAITINIALSLITCLRLFDQVVALTNGGPGYSTDTVSTVIYKQAFIQGRYALSAALSVILGVIVFVVVGAQVTVSRRAEAR